MNVITQQPSETINLGAQLAKKLKGGDILCLSGELGSGKTTLVKGIARGLKVDENQVNSPTYVLLNIYNGRLPVFHFDLYRLPSTQEISLLGYEEYLYGKGVSVIEWAENMQDLSPKEQLTVQLEHRKQGGRSIRLKAKGKRYAQILESLAT